MRIIQASHLKTWAGTWAAKGRFPHIVKALIQAVIQPAKLRMPSGDAVWVPGFDGVVESREEYRFVPIGSSVWEIGTNAKFKDKADKDYEKRSTNKSGDDQRNKDVRELDRSRTTFVFVTPHVWKDKDHWVAKRKRDGTWKDVWVIDGVDLLDWLEDAPAVQLQFAAELGLVPEAGLQTLEQAWEEWSNYTAPPASEELAVVGREKQEKEVIDRLAGDPQTCTVRGDSPREAWGFALAALRRAGSEGDLLNLHARTVVADDEKVASRLGHLENLIIVLKQARGQVSGFLSRRGCYVIVPEGSNARSERNVVELTRPTHRLFAEALGRMGLPDEEAERVTRECGRSVTIFQRRQADSTFEPPRWSQDENVVHLLPALLAGRWNDRNDLDREALCQLAGASDYSSVERQLQQFRLVDQPPLLKIGEMWTLTAPVDAFQLTARRLTTADLDRFKSTFIEVFGRIDPKVEIPPDEWFSFGIWGERGHSDWLRSGMAETLLLIAERGADASLDCLLSPRDYAEEVVRGLPGLNDDWRRLASLRDQYARLMEAAPGPLLDSLEHLLEAKPDDVRRLFVEGGLLGGHSLHTGLLWGLEALAWSPQYLSQVALALAKLASIDPGGRMANRPINSLREIFLWWHPGTNAPLETRLASIDLILDRVPDVGWDLIASLLPRAQTSISTPTAKPLWRDVGDLPEDTRTRSGQIRYMTAIVERALDRVGSRPDRWQAILDSLRVLNPSQQKKALKLLDAIAHGPTPMEVKAALWEVLRDFIYQHRTFHDANWALPKELIDRLEAILPLLAPADPVERNRWLFDEWLPDLESGEKDIERRQEQVTARRQQAVKEILQTQGTEGLVRLGTLCRFPGLVASVAVPLILELDAVRAFVEQAISTGEAGVVLASQISGQAQRLHGEGWRDLVRKEAKAGTWSPAVIASLLMWWPDRRATWDEAEALGVGAEYWRGKPIFALEGTPEEQAYQIDRLIEAERAAEAFERIALRGRTVPTEALLRLFDATLSALAKLQTPQEVRRLGLSSYHIQEFLDELRKRTDLSREELVHWEYRALPLLGLFNARGLTIHELMAENPDLFVGILCDAFLPAHRDKSEDAEPTTAEQARAQVAFRLLKGMEQVPGQRQGTQIDEAALLQWIMAVRQQAAAVDRAVIADEMIGHILAHSSEDPEDGGWPHQTVRNVIEKLTAGDIERGLRIERINMRGVYSKSAYEGGAQERALATQYRDWAETSRTRWPRMARVLETIAERWERVAKREDVRAEQDKLD